jgi:hypothetical protein
MGLAKKSWTERVSGCPIENVSPGSDGIAVCHVSTASANSTFSVRKFVSWCVSCVVSSICF